MIALRIAKKYWVEGRGYLDALNSALFICF